MDLGTWPTNILMASGSGVGAARSVEDLLPPMVERLVWLALPTTSILEEKFKSHKEEVSKTALSQPSTLVFHLLHIIVDFLLFLYFSLSWCWFVQLVYNCKEMFCSHPPFPNSPLHLSGKKLKVNDFQGFDKRLASFSIERTASSSKDNRTEYMQMSRGREQFSSIGTKT